MTRKPHNGGLLQFNPDIAREILLEAEKAPANMEPGSIEIEGRSEDEIYEHIESLCDDGYIEARITRTATGKGRIYLASIVRITAKGHDFLAKARDKKGWNKAKSALAASGATVTLDLAKDFLTSLVKRQAGLE